MKLIVQSDDYGITRAAAHGAVFAIKNGIIRNTGFFTNMKWADEVFEWIQPYLGQIAFGIDLNASTGPSVLGHDKVPTLTHEDGMFLGSRENRALDTEENGYDHLKEHKDELYEEFDAQIQKYISIVGHKPDYIHGHAYGTATTAEVIHELAVKYGCISTSTIMKRPEVASPSGDWYKMGGPEVQLTEDPVSFIVNDDGRLLASEKPYGYVISHCGYADIELFHLSSFNTCRLKDLECMTSEAIKSWVKENQIELVTFNDLPREWIERQTSD